MTMALHEVNATIVFSKFFHRRHLQALAIFDVLIIGKLAS